MAEVLAILAGIFRCDSYHSWGCGDLASADSPGRIWVDNWGLRIAGEPGPGYLYDFSADDITEGAGKGLEKDRG
jgi:hypothetical protein